METWKNYPCSKHSSAKTTKTTTISGRRVWCREVGTLHICEARLAVLFEVGGLLGLAAQFRLLAK